MSGEQREWRSLNDWERAILDRLLEPTFPGRDEIRLQLQDAVVRPIDDDGCVEFHVQSDAIADDCQTVPVSAQYVSEDGWEAFEVLLFTKDGRVDQLETIRHGRDKATELPPAKTWNVEVHRRSTPS